ncbi:uncharacterized protein HD556DRAFT_776249 [Suillus plorans]|uniref:Uncharacterized protein n=1 Tax=Suillus plorans TaxID=116603 RepID=A0A9P7AJ79_9AGAM|nr:uncharacterized protein HD556DRAFT_776249 [Suillus plorans]KAG1789525.1 hypothetical protein HD556DRAFT_776249 [Suillus plorans]
MSLLFLLQIVLHFSNAYSDLHSIAIAHQLPHTGEIHCPHPIMIFSFNQISAFKLDRNRKQFPLRPLYATTLIGCQGLTLEKSCLTCAHIRSHTDSYIPRIQEYDVADTFERYFQEKKKMMMKTTANVTSEDPHSYLSWRLCRFHLNIVLTSSLSPFADALIDAVMVCSA